MIFGHNAFSAGSMVYGCSFSLTKNVFKYKFSYTATATGRPRLRYGGNYIPTVKHLFVVNSLCNVMAYVFNRFSARTETRHGTVDGVPLHFDSNFHAVGPGLCGILVVSPPQAVQVHSQNDGTGRRNG